MKTKLKTKSKGVSPITYFGIGLVGAFFFLFGFFWTAGLIGFNHYGYVYLVAVVIIVTIFIAYSVKSVNKEAKAGNKVFASKREATEHTLKLHKEKLEGAIEPLQEEIKYLEKKLLELKKGD